MYDRFLQLRVIYRDPPDLMQLEVLVQYEGWAARSTVYASPHGFANDCERLSRWTKSLSEPLIIEAGADTGIGWLKLDFYTVDRVGHVACAVNLATGNQPTEARPAQTRRMAIEIPTEPALIEQFARACISLGKQLDGQAKLIGV